jgi:hypothetical protein
MTSKPFSKGMMGLLDSNKSDIALGPIALNYNRSLVSTFTRPLLSDEMSILSSYMESDSDIFKPLFTFLNKLIWLSLLISILLYSLIITLSKRFKSHENPLEYRFVFSH